MGCWLSFPPSQVLGIFGTKPVYFLGLGRGTFTSVYSSTEKATGRRYAMKIVTDIAASV